MKRLPILITLLILTACAAPTPSPGPASTATCIPSPTATLTPTAAGTPTPTKEPSRTPWPTHLPRPTPAPRSPVTFEQENGLPPGAIARLGRGEFLSVDLSPDAYYLVVGSTAGVSVYNAATFKELWFASTGDHVTGVTISPDSTMIAGAIRDEVAVWDIQTGDRLHVFGGYDGDVYTISWSPDSSRLFAGSYIGDPYSVIYGLRDLVPFNTMMVWDINSGELIYNLRSPDEETLLEDFSDNHFYLLESAWSHDGRYLVVGASYELYANNRHFYPGVWLIWWDMQTGEQAGYHQWGARSIQLNEIMNKDRFSIHPEQNVLAAATGKSPLFLDLETGQPVEVSLGIDPELHITGVTWPQQGNLFLTASHEVYEQMSITEDGADTLRVWDTEAGQLAGPFTRTDIEPDTDNYDALLNDFDWAPSGTEFAAAYQDWQVMVWDAQTGTQQLLKDAGKALIWFPDGQKLITYSMLAIKAWDSSTGQLLNSIETNRYIHTIDWSPDGSTIAAGTGSWLHSLAYERKLNMWDIASGQLRQVIMVDDLDIYGPIRAVDYSTTSSNLAVGMGSLFGHGAFMTWAETPQNPLLSKRFTYDQDDPDDWDTVWDVAWSPDETLIAIATSNRVHLVDSVTGEIHDTFENAAFVVDWSPDGKSIITWEQESGNVLLINVETKENLLSLPIDDQRPTHFEWSPDGKTIAISTGIAIVNGAGRAYLFDAQSGAAIKSLSAPDDPAPWPRQPREFPMTGLAWLDNQTIATSTGAAPNEVFTSHFDMGTYGGLVLIWDVETGEMLLELDGHNGEVQDLALSPDGSTLASASADGTVILWNVAQIMAMIED